jgi:hypothetical protein
VFFPVCPRNIVVSFLERHKIGVIVEPSRLFLDKRKESNVLFERRESFLEKLHFCARNPFKIHKRRVSPEIRVLAFGFVEQAVCNQIVKVD